MRIAVTYTGSEEKHLNYVRWLQAENDVAVLKLSADDNNLYALDDCDGLVLAGGRDIHPRFYNSQKTDYSNTPAGFDEMRDRFEIDVFIRAQQQNKPVLGICRGLQLVNCVFGGTLQQDLGEALNKIHRVEAVHDKAHGLSIAPDTLLHNITGTQRSVVNSAHHQAVQIVGKGLMVNCTADDGTVEGLEWANPSGKSFLLCVQWHPERMFCLQLQDAPGSKNIRTAFIEAIKKTKAGS